MCSPVMPTACLPRSFKRRPATRSIPSSSAPRNGSSRRWSAPTARTSCRSRMNSWRRCSGSAEAIPAASSRPSRRKVCWRPGAVRSWCATATRCGFAPACVTNPSKTTSRKCFAEFIPPKRAMAPEAGQVRDENQLAKSQTTHCFPAIPDYIAPQRVRCARSLWPGFLFRRAAPLEFQVFECDPEKAGPGFPAKSRFPGLSDQKKSHETSQRRHHRPRRPRQDHAGRSPAAAIRHLSREPARGRARDGFQRSGARARHHHPGQGGLGAVEGYPHQHRRYAGPRRFRWRGRAHPEHGGRRAGAGGRRRRSAAANQIRGLQGVEGRPQADRRHQQGRPSRRAADRSDQRGVRPVRRTRRQRRAARFSDSLWFSQAGLDGRKSGRPERRRHAAAVRPDPAPRRAAARRRRPVPHDRHHSGGQPLSRPHHHRPHHLRQHQAQSGRQGAGRRRQTDRERADYKNHRVPRHRAHAAERGRSRRYRRHCRPHQGYCRRYILRSFGRYATEGADKDSMEVSGRGELQLAILIETMRREGFELSVSRPRVVLKKDEATGEWQEPIEEVVIDVDEEHSGVVVQKMSERKAEMIEMRPSGGHRLRLVFYAPTRGLIGYQGELLTDTRGTAIMNRLFHGYASFKGDIQGRRNGVLISNDQGEAVAYAMFKLEDRGPMMIEPGWKVYKGMIVGEHTRDNDLEINVLKGKQLTNIRTTSKDEAVRLTPPIRMTLEKALAYIEDDELVEVTPKSIRLRKKFLDANDRKRAEKAKEAVA